jgi:hypothetical protein
MSTGMRRSDEWFAQYQRERFKVGTPIAVPAEYSPHVVIVPLERDVLPGCLEALALHPSVAWYHRMNVGAVEVDDRKIRFAFTGCSDVLGQLTRKFGGRALAVEVKRPGKEPTDDQAEFLWKVWNAGGCAFVATDASDIFRNIPQC